VDDSSPSLVRDPNKCVLCGDCVRMCWEIRASAPSTSRTAGRGLRAAGFRQTAWRRGVHQLRAMRQRLPHRRADGEIRGRCGLEHARRSHQEGRVQIARPCVWVWASASAESRRDHNRSDSCRTQVSRLRPDLRHIVRRRSHGDRRRLGVLRRKTAAESAHVHLLLPRMGEVRGAVLRNCCPIFSTCDRRRRCLVPC